MGSGSEPAGDEGTLLEERMQRSFSWPNKTDLEEPESTSGFLCGTFAGFQHSAEGQAGKTMKSKGTWPLGECLIKAPSLWFLPSTNLKPKMN